MGIRSKHVLPQPSRVYTVLNQKGGVGKSTIAMNGAAVTSNALYGDEENSPVLVASTDPQGSAIWWAARSAELGALPFHITKIDDPEQLRQLPSYDQFKRIWIDTPGWIGAAPSSSSDDFGRRAIDEALSITDMAVVPITTEPLSFDPTARTIDSLLLPRGIPFRVVINDFDPRDGELDLERTIDFIDSHGWPRAKTIIRHYKVHVRAAALGQVVTEYGENRVSRHAREDFQNLVLGLEVER
ncbi:ParA family protein [Tsukamurella ocularis]|uniref:ParA family protein n=1 Tax=Tsukamurella ocularis TaxID=1970234 RepID=UPI00216A6CE8